MIHLSVQLPMSWSQGLRVFYPSFEKMKKLELVVLFVGFIILSNSAEGPSASPCYEHFNVDGKFSYTVICCNVSSMFNLDLPPKYKARSVMWDDHALNITDSNVPTLPAKAFSKVPHVTILDLSGINLKTIEPKAFENLTLLRELHLENNELTELMKYTFDGLHLLRLLNLTGNKIFKIENGTFDDATYGITKLYLAYNRLSSFEAENIFVDHLDLSGNPLEKSTGACAQYLILSNTSLNEFTADMTNYHCIRKLDLSRNLITSFNCNSSGPELEDLNLSNNQIASLNGCWFYQFASLNLRNNRIRTLNKTVSYRHSYTYHHLHLDLSYNEISTIDKDISLELKKTSILNLAFNKITKIPNGLFKYASRLIELDLSSNLIESFQYGSFDGLSELVFLNISNNKLLDLNPNILQSMPNLKSWSFDNNAISSFDTHYIETVPTFRRLVRVSLNHNPWNCEDLIHITHRLDLYKIHVIEGDTFDTENHRGIACFSRGHSEDSNSTA